MSLYRSYFMSSKLIQVLNFVLLLSKLFSNISYYHLRFFFLLNLNQTWPKILAKKYNTPFLWCSLSILHMTYMSRIHWNCMCNFWDGNKTYNLTYYFWPPRWSTFSVKSQEVFHPHIEITGPAVDSSVVWFPFVDASLHISFVCIFTSTRTISNKFQGFCCPKSVDRSSKLHYL